MAPVPKFFRTKLLKKCFSDVDLWTNIHQDIVDFMVVRTHIQVNKNSNTSNVVAIYKPASHFSDSTLIDFFVVWHYYESVTVVSLLLLL